MNNIVIVIVVIVVIVIVIVIVIVVIVRFIIVIIHWHSVVVVVVVVVVFVVGCLLLVARLAWLFVVDVEPERERVLDAEGGRRRHRQQLVGVALGGGGVAQVERPLEQRQVGQEQEGILRKAVLRCELALVDPAQHPL